MAKFVDERVESLLPCIIKKVEDQLKNKESKPAKVEGVKHESFIIRHEQIQCFNDNVKLIYE